MVLVPIRATFSFFVLFLVKVLNVSLVCKRVGARLIIKIKIMAQWRNKDQDAHTQILSNPAVCFFHLVFIAAGFKPPAQKAEECLQKIRALQKEGWWQLLCCLFICIWQVGGVLKVL